MRLRRWWMGSTLALLVPVLAACGSGDTSYVKVRASDATALRQALGEVSIDGYDAIELNVVAVRLRIKEEDQKGKDGSWHDLPLYRFENLRGGHTESGPGDRPGDERDDRVILDLVRLLSDKGFTIAEGEVPAGVLTQIRFVLDSREQGWAYPKGTNRSPQHREPVFVPSGSQSGLKLTGAKFHLEAGEDVALDLLFDARASVREHKDGSLRVRPVIQLRNAKTVPVDSDRDRD